MINLTSAELAKRLVKVKWRAQEKKEQPKITQNVRGNECMYPGPGVPWLVRVFTSYLGYVGHLIIYISTVFTILATSLRKQTYSNILKISSPKIDSFQIKIQIFFIFLLKT